MATATRSEPMPAPGADLSPGARPSQNPGDRLGETIPAARTDQRHDVRSLRGDPGDCRLGDGDALSFRDYAQRFDQRQVGIDVSALEARAVAAEIQRCHPDL